MATPQQLGTLGQRILKKRRSQGLNQKQLAQLANLDQGVLSRVESGQVEPSLATLHKLRDALRVDDDAFLGWLDLLRPAHRNDAA